MWFGSSRRQLDVSRADLVPLSNLVISFCLYPAGLNDCYSIACDVGSE